MSNIGIIIGTGPFGEDSLYKSPWIRYISGRHHIFVTSRIKPAIHYNDNLRKVIGDEEFVTIRSMVSEIELNSSLFETIYDSSFLKRELSPKEIIEAEDFLGVSLDFLTDLNSSMKNRSGDDDHFIIRRRLFAAQLVYYFRDFFHRNEINILMNTIEDDVVSTIAHYVARKMGIIIIGSVWGRFPGRGIMFAKNFSDVCLWNTSKVNWSEIESLYEASTIAGRDVLERNRGHWDLLSFPNRLEGFSILGEYDNYVRQIRRMLPNEELVFRDFSGGNLWRAYLDFSVKFLRKMIVRGYFENPPTNEDFFLFPLHYTIDAQITFREPFIDQMRLVESVSRSLPISYKLYLKPHPHYFGTDSRIADLKRMSRLENVRIINPEIPSVDLMMRSKGVITINSTTGFEALIMHIPVITFGHDFYCRKDLCHVVRDMNELPEILHLISNEKRDESESREFAKNVFLNTIHIKGRTFRYGFLGLTDEDGREIASSLNKILDSVDGDALRCL